MMRLLALAAGVFLTASSLAQDDLPAHDETEALDIEPPLLIQNGVPLSAAGDTPAQAEADPERLQTLLERAKLSAASGERLCRAGIIAKVQAEERLIKVARLEADLAAARMLRAKDELVLREQRLAAGEIQRSQLDQSVAAVGTAVAEAKAAAEERDRAERDFAEANLHRQQKLLALGSGRKADVERAAEKLAALAQRKD